jgi:hypothetical protein
MLLSLGGFAERVGSRLTIEELSLKELWQIPR